jgi:hypothetical protein
MGFSFLHDGEGQSTRQTRTIRNGNKSFIRAMQIASLKD